MEREIEDPTPQEIQERCAAIRAGWSETERIKRRDSLPRFMPRDWQLVEEAEQAAKSRRVG